MILVQKPPSQSLPNIRRRYPLSSPTVVVHPTRTPGLLNLSKPARPPITPPLPRGRGEIKHPRDKVQIKRSPSHPSVPEKQPSFPIPQPSPQSGKSVNLSERCSPATRHRFDNGLQLAPFSVHDPDGFSSNATESPPSPVANKRRKHRRIPSEGVFYMSSDEDLSSGPGGTVLNPNVQAFFGLVNTFKPNSKMSSSAYSTPIRAIPKSKRDSTSPSNGSLKGRHSEREAAERAAGYFASSIFQNSPSPDELPDPLLF